MNQAVGQVGHARWQWLDQVPDLVAVNAALPERFPYLLDQAAGPGVSLLLWAEGEQLVQLPDGRLDGPGTGSDFFQRLQSWVSAESTGQQGPAGCGVDVPFAGGWFLYLGYEMSGVVEPSLRLPRQTTALPDALAQRCPGAIVVLTAGAHDETQPRAMLLAESDACLQRMIACLENLPTWPRRAIPVVVEQWSDPGAAFESAVEAVLEYLAAGDVFQVNISRAFGARFADAPDTAALYRRLAQANPAPFAGLMRYGDTSLLSSSPERLVRVIDGWVDTRPIAGTRPRASNQLRDRELARELLANIKERAEHIMLIDLERNDLGRVCRPGSVEVDELMVLESHAHVHHIVSNVRGQLRSDQGPVDALRAVFPGGTITGCPKVRCMQIIAELEQCGRGFYTGSMGYLGIDGRMDLNILIRSMLLQGNRLQFRTGAGIVVDSVPSAELQETEDKARGLLLALEVGKEEAQHA